MKYSCNVIYNRGILMAFTSPFKDQETIFFGIEEKPEAKFEGNQGHIF